MTGDFSRTRESITFKKALKSSLMVVSTAVFFSMRPSTPSSLGGSDNAVEKYTDLHEIMFWESGRCVSSCLRQTYYTSSLQGIING